MIIFFLVATITIFSVNNFINMTAKESINQRFYTSLKSSLENSITLNDSLDDVYIDLHTLSNVLSKTLSYNLIDFADNFYLYINSYYNDLTPCTYACKTVNVRLKVNVNVTFTYDKSYKLSLEENYV